MSFQLGLLTFKNDRCVGCVGLIICLIFYFHQFQFFTYLYRHCS